MVMTMTNHEVSKALEAEPVTIKDFSKWQPGVQFRLLLEKDQLQ
jgi:hypothetical protein